MVGINQLNVPPTDTVSHEVRWFSHGSLCPLLGWGCAPPSHGQGRRRGGGAFGCRSGIAARTMGKGGGLQKRAKGVMSEEATRRRRGHQRLSPPPPPHTPVQWAPSHRALPARPSLGRRYPWATPPRPAVHPRCQKVSERHGCIRREGTAEAVRQAVGGGCQSGLGAVTVGYKCR